MMRSRFGSLQSRAPAGFSLLETLVSVSMFLIVLYAVYSVYDVGEANYQKSSRKWDVQSEARVALERMAREIRTAGYASPTKVTDPVVIATNDTISIHADVGETDGSGNPIGARYITYSRRDCAGNVGNTLYRSTPASPYCGGEPFIDNVTSLTFTYYELNNVPIPLPASAPYQPTPPYQLDSQAPVTGTTVPAAAVAGGERDRVRQVKIAITVQQAVSGVLLPFTTTTDVALRNLRP